MQILSDGSTPESITVAAIFDDDVTHRFRLKHQFICTSPTGSARVMGDQRVLAVPRPPDSLATLSDLYVHSTGIVDAPAPTSESESCVFAAATPSDIQTLVDVPCRTLDVEYKSW